MKLSPYDKAIREAGRKLPFASEKKQNEMLEWAAGSLAEAYRIGAEEAQCEIGRRLMVLRAKEEPK